jgi:hypothetical protein
MYYQYISILKKNNNRANRKKKLTIKMKKTTEYRYVEAQSLSWKLL